MRRTGSSSCLLKPKKSLSQHDLALLQDKAPTATVLTVNRLPPYVTDRLYMLSELQVHAHSIQFLCDLKKNGAKASSLPSSVILYMRWKPGTYPTPLSFADGPLSECVRQCLIANGDSAPLDELELVRSRPREIPYSPRRQHNDELPAQTLESLTKMCIPLPLSSNDGESTSKPTRSIETKHYEENENTQLTNIYVVVDRISPDSNSEIPDLPDLSCTSYESTRRGEHSESSTQLISSTNQQQSQSQSQSAEQTELEQLNQHNNEMKVAKSLARAIASSRFLRNRIDGVTIGITSDARAAPGLEACMDTVARGAKERRRASISKPARERNAHNCQGRREEALNRLREKSPERSPIAIVACEPDDLEHDQEYPHHHHHDADANNKTLQSRIITEWNGKGDCDTFVDRAMSDWRQAWSVSSGADKGITNFGSHQGKTRPKVPRISRKEDESEYEEEYDIDEPVSTLMIIVLMGGILAYLWNLYGDEIHSLLTGDV